MEIGAGAPTFHLFKALPMQATDLNVLLLEDLKTFGKWKCDMEFVFVVVVSTGLGVVDRSFHLTDCGHNVLGLLNHPLLFSRDLTNLVV